MAEQQPPITSFDLLESHKENIQPLRSGRSAQALAAALSPLSLNPSAARSQYFAQQEQFEEELKTSAESDDPLDVWLRYIKWTMETFTSGNSAESGLRRLLERATREFVQDNLYKNDIRYVKLWIQYAQDYFDAPREVYVYLAQNDIGQKLALYYEEYAALLESLGQTKKATEVYNIGIDKNATPLKRLQRKFEEFLQRMEANQTEDDGSSSPVMPIVRPVLATKSDIMPIEGLRGLQEYQQQQPQPQATKPSRKTMAIPKDGDQEPAIPEKLPGVWASIGTLDHRKKENTYEPKSWAGEVMKQQAKKRAGEKITVFKDGEN